MFGQPVRPLGLTSHIVDSPLTVLGVGCQTSIHKLNDTLKGTTMSHDATTRKVFGLTLETITRRILRTFDAATASDVEAGARWYDEAHSLAVTLSAHVDNDVDRAAAVISALSPRAPWARNVAGATALLTSGPMAARRLGCIGANVGRATRAADESLTPNPFAVFGPTAPKTRAFALNIAGDREAVTVDVWAARVADLDETLLSRVGAYDAIAHAYRLAARRRGVDSATMQATCWIIQRNGRAG